MIKIEKAKIFGWEGAIEGARFPMNSEDRSDTWFLDYWIAEYEEMCCHSLNVDCSSMNETGDLNEDGHSIWEMRWMARKEGTPAEQKECNLETAKVVWPYPDDFHEKFPVKLIIGPADHKLLMNLAKGGSEEAKWRRMVHVQMNVTAPLYWWKEFETYKVGTVSNSCSTMHKIHSKEFSLEDFSCEHLIRVPDYEECPDFKNNFLADMLEWSKRNEEIDPNECMADINPYPKTANEREMDWCEEKGAYEIGEDNVNPEFFEDYVVAKYSIDLLNETIKALNHYRKKFLETKDKRFWWQMIQLLPSSYNQKRKIDLNYEVLAKQYRERKEHKLDEWRQYCEWIKTLPYSEFITLEENE